MYENILNINKISRKRNMFITFTTQKHTFAHQFFKIKKCSEVANAIFEHIDKCRIVIDEEENQLRLHSKS